MKIQAPARFGTRVRQRRLWAFLSCVLPWLLWALFTSLADDYDASITTTASLLANEHLRQLTNTSSSSIVFAQNEDERPFLVECTSGCIQFAQPNSFCTAAAPGSPAAQLVPLRRYVQARDWEVRNLTTAGAAAPSNQIIPAGEEGVDVVVAFVSMHSNINHAFHDNFGALLPLCGGSNNVTIISSIASPWLAGLLQWAAPACHWNLIAAPMAATDQAQVYCMPPTPEDTTRRRRHLFVSGFVRNLKKLHLHAHAILQFQNALQQQALDTQQPLAHPLQQQQQQQQRSSRIVIYTRMDAEWRQLHQASVLLDILDVAHHNVTILNRMPPTLAEQAALFGSVDLFIAPNGGWAPNVLFLQPTACVVELHLYATDSWLQRFGLAQALRPFWHLLLVTGNYSGGVPRQWHPARGAGGDEALVAGELLHDVQTALYRNRKCRHFLSSQAQWQSAVEELLEVPSMLYQSMLGGRH